MHEGGDSQSDVEEVDRLAKEKWTYVAPSYEKGFLQKLLQGRTTLPRSRQRRHKKQNAP